MAKTENETNLSADVEALKADLTRIKEDLGTIAEGLMGKAKNRARMARQNVESKVESSLGSLEEYVEERPLTTVLVAFGVGLVLGKLFNSK